MRDRRHVMTGLAALPLMGLAAGACARSGADTTSPDSTSGLVAAGARARSGAPDARLVAIAAELENLERRCEATPGTVTDTSALDDLVAGFESLEDELAEIAAESLDGVLAKVRALDIRTVAANPENGIALSIAADVRRLHGLGRIVHG